MGLFSWVLCVSAAVCATGRGTLLVIITMSLTLLLVTAFYQLWQYGKLSAERVAAVLVSVGVGGALWRCFSALSPQNAEDLGGALPLCVLFVLCAFAAKKPPPLGQLIKGASALLVIGCVRELLTFASLFGYPFSFAAAGSTFGRSGAGGLLIAAGVLYVWGIACPFPKSSPARAKESFSLGLVTAAAGLWGFLLKNTLPSLSASWQFFAAVLLSVPFFLYSRVPTVTLVIPPTLIALYTDTSPVTAVVIGVGACVLWAAGSSLVDRLHRASLPRRFCGPPLTLVFAAIAFSVAGAI